MASVTTTGQARAQAMSDVQTTWLAGNLQANLTAFCAQLLPSFPQNLSQGVGVAWINNGFNQWLAILSSLAASMPIAPTQPSYAQYYAAAIGVARMYAFCTTVGILISVPANAALIAKYNANFG